MNFEFQGAPQRLKRDPKIKKFSSKKVRLPKNIKKKKIEVAPKVED